MKKSAKAQPKVAAEGVSGSPRNIGRRRVSSTPFSPAGTYD